MNERISIDRVLSKLDGYFAKNDYASAQRHLKYWLCEAKESGDVHAELLIENELMGLMRKTGKEDEATDAVRSALSLIEREGISHQVGAATTYINAATVYKAFGKAHLSMPLFERARDIYERELESDDARLGGLYNNTALALVDLGRYAEARKLYSLAIDVMKKNKGGELEIAITHLNIASAAESEYGLLDADEFICECLDRAEELLEAFEERDGYYAFVCEKCASVFGYYGRFVYERELCERARRIYEGT